MTEPVSPRDTLIEQLWSLLPEQAREALEDAGMAAEDVVAAVVDSGRFVGLTPTGTCPRCGTPLGDDGHCATSRRNFEWAVVGKDSSGTPYSHHWGDNEAGARRFVQTFGKDWAEGPTLWQRTVTRSQWARQWVRDA